MPDNTVPKKATDMVAALFDLLYGPEQDVRELPIEKVRADLNDYNIDPDFVLASVKDRLNALRRETTARKAQEMRKRLARVLADQPKDSLVRQKLRSDIMDILKARTDVSLAYRKFEDASDADLVSYLEDLSIIEELQNKEDEGQA